MAKITKKSTSDKSKYLKSIYNKEYYTTHKNDISKKVLCIVKNIKKK